MADVSICARCGVHSSSSGGHPLVGQVPLCPTCASQVADWPYPSWLKAALALLLALLAVALVHGRKYFHAGRTMYIGERLVNEGNYSKALPYLLEALQVAPGSDKAVLLAAKAALKTGDVETADKVLQAHNGGRFENGQDSRFLEVNGLMDRANGALEKADKAEKMANQDGQAAEAARLMHEAAQAYPEAAGLAIAAELFDAGAAFERADYDTFLSISQKEWQDHPVPSTAAGLASALACKYAVTGDARYRRQSEEMLKRAQQLAAGDQESLNYLQEFAERNQYRLESRKIISKNEYDRRFRSDKKK